MWKPAIPIADPRAVAAKGYQGAMEIAAPTLEFNPDARAGVVIEDGEIARVVIALDEDQAKREGLA
jgi:hypothetical protein